MINNLDELVAFTHRIAEKYPLIRDDIRLRRRGCDEDEIAQLLVRFPAMPESYLSVARFLDLNCATIGYFVLSPCSSPRTSLVQKLIECDDPILSPHTIRYRRDGVYQVASWEANLIAIVFEPGEFERGQLLLYHIGHPHLPSSILADNFKQMLLMAGTLDEVRDRYADANDSKWAIAEFKGDFQILAGSSHEALWATWQMIAEDVLG